MMFVSQLQDMNTCQVGSGLLQGSSTFWLTHLVSVHPVIHMLLYVSLSHRDSFFLSLSLFFDIVRG